MFRFLKKRPKEAMPEPPACTLLFTVDYEGNISIMYGVEPGKEEEFISLLYQLSSGDLMEIINDEILEQEKIRGGEEIAQYVVNKVRNLIIKDMYNNNVELEEEDPIISPSDVFKD